MSYYKNFFTRFIFRKNWPRRVRMRLRNELRKLTKNEFDDIEFLFDLAGVVPSLIIDGGANIGYWTWQFQKRFPNAEIHAFEPNPLVFESLKASYEKSQRVFTYNKGLGAKASTLTFHVNRNSGTSSFLEPTEYHKSNLAKNRLNDVAIPVTSLDDLFFDSGKDISILKIDVEGFELEVLKGCEKLLRSGRILAIVSEYNLVPTYENQPLLHDLMAFLLERDYTPFNLYGYHETEIRQMLIGNIVFLSPKLRAQIEKAVGKLKCGW